MLIPRTVKKEVLLYPCLGALFMLIVAWLDLHEQGILTDDNYFYLAIATTVTLFSLKYIRNNTLDRLIFLVLLVSTLSGPIRSQINTYLMFRILGELFDLLLIIYSWKLYYKIIEEKEHAIIVPPLVSLLFFTFSLVMLYSFASHPGSLIFRVNGKVVINFYQDSFFYGIFLNALLVIIPLLFILFNVFYRHKAIKGAHERHFIQAAGVFLCYVIEIIRVLFQYEGATSRWVHVFVEIFDIVPLLIWYISFRLKEDFDHSERVNVYISGQLILLLPLVYFTFAYTEKNMVLISIVLASLFEIFFFMFKMLIYQRVKIIELGRVLYDSLNHFSVVWQRNMDDIIVADWEGNILQASERLAQLRGKSVIGEKLQELVMVNESPVQNFSFTPEPSEGWFEDASGNRQQVKIAAHQLQYTNYQFQCAVLSPLRPSNESMHNSNELQLRVQALKNRENLYQMGAEISHHFNNYLNAISGSIELTKIALHKPEKMNRYLERMAEQTEEAAQFVRNMINAVEKKTHLALEPVDLKKVINEATTKLHQVLESGSNKYSITQQYSGPLFPVIGTEEQLVEVMYQLLMNSVEAMPDGGKIDISVRSVAVESNADIALAMLRRGSYMEISVKDSGKGVDRKHADLLFNPFFSTSNLVGKGLGLTLAYGITKQFKGEITFENNEDGKGVTFHVYLRSTI